ncbi:MAG: hypothetical protein KC503_44200 [Myxococcales bacterium]|nr:hypothetical protein [Myxococcales bacterium]
MSAEALDIADYNADEDLLDALRADGRARVRVYRPARPLVVLGRGSKPHVELHIDACLADGVSVTRRRGGGCAVVLDEGNVIVAAVHREAGFGANKRLLDDYSRWLIDGLARSGVPEVRFAGICDLAVGERKIAGACLYRARDVVFYSASLLVAPRLELLSRYLAHPPREPDYRRGRAHDAFVTTLDAHVGGLAAETLEARLRATLDPFDS